MDSIDKPRRPCRFYNQPFAKPSKAGESAKAPDNTDFETGYLPLIEINPLTEQNVPPVKKQAGQPVTEASVSQSHKPLDEHPLEKWQTD